MNKEYELAVAKRIICEQNFKNTQAELDSLVLQAEACSRQVAQIASREEAAKKEVEELPARIETLKAKMAASKMLFAPNSSSQ